MFIRAFGLFFISFFPFLRIARNVYIRATFGWLSFCIFDSCAIVILLLPQPSNSLNATKSFSQVNPLNYNIILRPDFSFRFGLLLPMINYCNKCVGVCFRGGSVAQTQLNSHQKHSMHVLSRLQRKPRSSTY